MATTITDLKTRLNAWLRDGENQTFTDDEKTELLTQAINDPFVYGVVRDSTLTTAANTYTYAVPAGIEDIYELGIDVNSDGIFHPLPRSAWDLINGTIYFSDKSLPSGKAIQIIGINKYTTATSDFPVKVQEYILHLAMVAAYEMIKASKTTFFVINDITMSDIINSMSTHERKIAEHRRSLANQRLVVL